MIATTTHWETIADCLREEISDYGALLSLFETQQQALLDRDAETVLRIAAEIEGNTKFLGQARTRREKVVAEFATENGASAGSTLRSLLFLIEPDARPLLNALIDEVNSLLHRTKRTSRHNYALLQSTVEVGREALGRLAPQALSSTYGTGGRVSVVTSPRISNLSASG